MSNARNLAQQAVTSLDFRNRIINGDMRVDQRFKGVETSATGYNLDRWQISQSVAARLSTQQVLDAPAGFTSSAKIKVLATTTAAAGDFYSFTQIIEGQNHVDFGLGTASCVPITVSLYGKASVAGNYAVAARNAAGTRSYIGVVALTTTWSRQTFTLAPESTGVWATDTAGGLSLWIDLGSGTNFNTTAGAWQTTSSLRTSGTVSLVAQAVGATLNITGVQIEAGAVPTPFENRPAGLELALCQRYFEIFQGVAIATSSIFKDYYFKVTKRVTPTVALISVSTGTGVTFVVQDANRAYQETLHSAPANFVASASAEI